MKFWKSLIIAFITCWTMQSDASAMDSVGSLFGVDISNDQLVSIDPETGIATVVGPTGAGDGQIFDTAYDPVSNQLLGVRGNILFEIDP